MNYDIKAIPTWYKGRKYRSRLEAKWQIMFDKLGWEAQYEPSQINGYNPDFTIRSFSNFYPNKIIIVEVKPSVFITDEYISEVQNKYMNVGANVLILDDMPFLREGKDYRTVKLGIGAETDKGKILDFHNVLMKGNNDFSTCTYSFDGWLYNNTDRKSWMDIHEDYNEWTLLHDIWNNAGNELMFNVK
jgi:hypothetical protein